MFIEQIYTNCLAEAAYYIESEGQAIIIDPIRETEPYLKKLTERNASLKYVFETHFHADFVSGHIDLANRTRATIVYGPNAHTNYQTHTATDGEIFKLGKITIEVLHTPGHTLESTCYLLRDENNKPHCIFTGDTLFVGDVGRPDLLDGVMSKDDLAALMYQSLNQKIKVLPDDVIVYPAHGPGSACGKNIGKETWSTIGNQKQNNYYLLETDKEKFIQVLTSGLATPPAYFFEDAKINKQGYANVDDVIARNSKPLSVNEFENQIKQGAWILDTRPAAVFETAFITGSINIGLNGQFAVWAGTLLPITQKLILVTDAGAETESVLRLARVGFENVAGVLAGGINAWQLSGKPVEKIQTITPDDLKTVAQTHTIIDVRKPSEWEGGIVQDARLIALADLSKTLSKLDTQKPYAIHCAGGYRSMIAASMMQAKGFYNIVNVDGGFAKIKDTGIALTTPIVV